jgi:hypothetical protein
MFVHYKCKVCGSIFCCNQCYEKVRPWQHEPHTVDRLGQDYSGETLVDATGLQGDDMSL